MSQPFRRFIAPLLAALVILIALLFAVAWIPLREARHAWRHGDNAKAIAIANRWSQLHVWPSQYHEVLAAAFLTSGNATAAHAHLAPLRGTETWFPVIDKSDVARQLFAAGRYSDFLDYDGASHDRSESAEVALYRAAALTATNRTADADAILRTIDRGSVDAKKLAALQASLAQRRGGSYPLLVDRNGGAIANYRVADRKLIAVDSRFAPLVSALPPLDANDTIETTLDPNIQQAALTALGTYRGSVVAIDPRTNELLAIASSSPDERAIYRQYEPGSVVKVLTGLNAIANDVDVKSMFPYHCTGDLVIDGRHFADWVPQGHGILPSLDDAFAQSCNIVFADIGLRLGPEKIERFMKSAGFDDQTNLGLFEAPLGKILPPIASRYDTAFLAIGLEHESVNTLHVAMLASMMANRGVLTQPRLVRNRRSMLGEVVGGPPLQGSARIASADAAQQMVQAMTAVVTEPRGTGHRAQVEGITVAMKTGTAGAKGKLQAVILAFAPVESPKIAFAIIAEDAGPAEFAGAKIAHDFLEAVKSRL